MIDPLKATKGRRMSKKTRKKSPKTSSKKPAAKKAARAVSKTSAKNPVTKTAAKKPAKANASPTASHKATSKKLKAAAPQKPAPSAAARSLQKQPETRAATAPRKSAVLTEGVKAPAFQLPRDGGNSVSPADYAGQKLVIFFYPRADTPGCTKEAIDFTRLSGAFADSQTAVLGVSADPLRAQEAFRDKHQLSIPLVSDEQHEMLKAYGVWAEKSMYGKTFFGIVRTTVLIGADGRIARIWRNVKVDGHADEVLAAARGL
jgi:thioredoxin-dependent peroxiredoxin